MIICWMVLGQAKWNQPGSEEIQQSTSNLVLWIYQNKAVGNHKIGWDVTISASLIPFLSYNGNPVAKHDAYTVSVGERNPKCIH